ncbi:hypothetical protein BGZ83_011951 [Gryganskiella cystojenkinii]|nr:hypothetical protein BGZ83_011951 [Gryganskiella cystojenkinii]
MAQAITSAADLSNFFRSGKKLIVGYYKGDDQENQEMASTFDLFVGEYKDKIEECLFFKVDLDKVSGISSLEPDADKDNKSIIFPVFSVYDQSGRKAGEIQGSDPEALTDLILSCQ